MHRWLAEWLTEHPWRTVIIAACLGILSLQGTVLFVVLASAVPVLLLLERGVRAGVNAMLAGAVAVLAMLLWVQQSWWLALCYPLVLLGLPMVLGAVLWRWHSLHLVFQLVLLLALGCIAAVFMILPAPAAIWVSLLQQAFAALDKAGLQMDATLIDQLAYNMWGAFVAVVMLVNFSAVLLARWWQSLLHAPGEFGREFRQLRCGAALGSVLIVITIVALFTRIAWLDSMAWVAMLGLAMQGLAAVHRRKAAGRLPQGWLVAIYVMLIVPLFSFITVAVLATWGLLDFWRRLRVGAAQPT